MFDFSVTAWNTKQDFFNDILLVEYQLERGSEVDEFEIEITASNTVDELDWLRALSQNNVSGFRRQDLTGVSLES